MSEMFNETQTLKEIHEELMRHLKEETSVLFQNGEWEVLIPENGECSWWFNDLVETILRKAKNHDAEIIAKDAADEIGLYEKRLKTNMKQK